jgi:hypothetical protein
MFNLKQGAFWSTYHFFHFCAIFCSVIEVQGNININNDMIVNLNFMHPKKNQVFGNVSLGEQKIKYMTYKYKKWPMLE